MGHPHWLRIEVGKALGAIEAPRRTFYFAADAKAEALAYLEAKTEADSPRE
jgi:hypothetical protein